MKSFFCIRLTKHQMNKTRVMSDSNPTEFETDYESQPPAVAIVSAIAAIEDTPPTELDFSLYDSIDPEALNKLVGDSGNTNMMIEFTIDGYEIQIQQNGTLTVTAPDIPE